MSVLKPPAAILRAENLHRFFVDGGRHLDVLQGITLTLNAGQVSALVGRSGSGKSTLLHLLGLLDLPNSGSILIDGTPTESLNEKDRSYMRNRFIGFVFQHYFLLPEYNVLENVLMPAHVSCSLLSWLSRKRAHLERAAKLLEMVGLAKQMRQRTNTLSGGERQRVALARALMLEPKILLCDEPTGNLDPETASLIMDLIFECSRKFGAAVLVVTHDQALTARAHQVLRLDHGILKMAP